MLIREKDRLIYNINVRSERDRMEPDKKQNIHHTYQEICCALYRVRGKRRNKTYHIPQILANLL